MSGCFRLKINKFTAIHGFFCQVHFQLRKWLHDNVGAEVAASTRIIYGGIFSLH
jgi:hypothetical protein